MTTPIEPNPPRWIPSTDPASIVVPGLDTNAPINDQIDQIEQLITIKLQVSSAQDVLSQQRMIREEHRCQFFEDTASHVDEAVACCETLCSWYGTCARSGKGNGVIRLYPSWSLFSDISDPSG